MEDAFIMIAILIFVAGLLFLTLGHNLRARLRASRQASPTPSNASPPPYFSIGFPPSGSHDISLSKSGSSSPALDPYRVVAPSFDSSLLLKDDYFTHVPQPERTFASSRSAPSRQLISGVGLGLGNVHTGPATPVAAPPPASASLTPPPPAYVQDSRHGAEDAPVLELRFMTFDDIASVSTLSIF
ncbi:hypothetical protein C8R43DRAFT_1119418 [Mycena crocata]|nr:hypothetical protein C8R43DRAFT_1119418 [Mycena crocata]